MRDLTDPNAKPDLSTLTQRSRLPVELRNATGLQKLDWILSLSLIHISEPTRPY